MPVQDEKVVRQKMQYEILESKPTQNTKLYKYIAISNNVQAALTRFKFVFVSSTFALETHKVIENVTTPVHILAQH